VSGVYRLLISAPDAQGLVAKVSDFIASCGGNITEAHHFLDQTNSHFFMRNEIEINSLVSTQEEFSYNFQKIADKYQMQFSLTSSLNPKKMLILGSKTTHCVSELLHKHTEGDLPADIVGLWSNHQDLAKLSKFYDIDFRYFDLHSNTNLINDELEKQEVDLVVLARYMQIIPPQLTHKFVGKIINIHHSFLPSFKGGNPYKQAEERGVKLIGATCHFVNENLDDGAIIEQSVARVSHNDDAGSMKKIGRDIEKITLAKGVKLFLEDRIIIHHNKTIIFN
jgi:formyltetrahydrofolate deformylase